MIIERRAREPLTAVELNHGQTLRFIRADGTTAAIEVVDSGAEIMATTLAVPGEEETAATTTYRFWADLRIDGEPHQLEREVGTQQSFYEPWEIAGLRIWLDAVDAIFDFMRETHSPCRLQATGMHGGPAYRQVRLAVQDATLRICPERVHPWCPLPEGGLRIEDCYRGEDCWMGAYDGASAHGGLDINQPKGTPLFAPIALDDQFLYNSTAGGHNNNRWRGIRQWPDGSTWVLASCHMVEQTVPPHTPLAAGEQVRRGGRRLGRLPRAHSHFAFSVLDHGELIRPRPVDPVLADVPRSGRGGVIRGRRAGATLRRKGFGGR